MALSEKASLTAALDRARRRDGIAGLFAVSSLLAFCAAVGLVGWGFAVGGSLATAGLFFGLYWIGRRQYGVSAPKDTAAGEPLVLSPAASRLIEKLPDPLLVLDGAGRILGSNGASHAMIAGATARRHVSVAVRAPGVLEAVEVVLRGGPAQTVEYTNLVPVERHFLAYVAPVELGNVAPGELVSNQARGAIVVLRDLTAQKRVERMRADFVANASHELRTPLASLSGFIETLRGHAKDDLEARERFLEIMTEQAARMRRLIEDLLSLSRIELNEHVRPETVLRIDEVVRDVVDGFIPQAQARNMLIDLKVVEPVFSVLGDRDELYQVVQNLLDNALKYGSAGPRVEITVESSDAAIANGVATSSVTVRDFGEGIEREHIPRLTERFYRVDVRHSRQKGGTGLGLAIVKHIVNRHRGWLAIESTVGEGAAFSVYLPQAAKERPYPRMVADSDGPGVKSAGRSALGVSGAAAV